VTGRGCSTLGASSLDTVAATLTSHGHWLYHSLIKYQLHVILAGRWYHKLYNVQDSYLKVALDATLLVGAVPLRKAAANSGTLAGGCGRRDI
jgi:hypothetical protein